MKRSGPLARRTPLETRSELRRTALNRSPASASLAHDRAKRGNQPPKRSTARDTGPTTKVRALIAARSQGWCEWLSCTNAAVQVHHRRPRRMGGSSDPGTNQPSNLVHLCVRCHDYAESHRHQALQHGVLLHAGTDPKAVPVQLRHGLVLLTDDGKAIPFHTPEEIP